MLNTRAFAMLGVSALVAVIVFVALLYLGFSVDLFAFSIVSAAFGFTAFLIDANYRLLGNEEGGKLFNPLAGGQLLAPIWCFGAGFLLVAAGLFGLGVLAGAEEYRTDPAMAPRPQPRNSAGELDPNDKPQASPNGFIKAVDESLRRTFAPVELDYDKWWPPEPVEYQGRKYWGVRVRYFHRTRTGSQGVAERTAVLLGGVVIGWMNERDLGPRSTFTPLD